MIELVLLAMMNRLANWGLTPIVVTRTVAADAAALRELLSDPANQQRLLPGACARAELAIKPSPSRRVITTELLIGRRTVAWLTWLLTSAGGTTEIDLVFQPEQRGAATRLALVLGGRRWLARRLEAALATLATTAAHVVEHAVAASASDAAGDGRRGRRSEPLIAGGHAVEHR